MSNTMVNGIVTAIIVVSVIVVGNILYQAFAGF